MKSKKIASSAEEMRQKLFGHPATTASESVEGIGDRFRAYWEYIGKTVTIPVEHISLGDNVRKTVDMTSPKFLELVDSIRREGLLQNLVVDVRSGPQGTYLACVSGQRRLLAAKEAGVEKAVCLLKQYGEAERISIGLTENLVRQDLHCLDVAEGYAELRRRGWAEEEIAARFEREQRTVHRYLLIAAWPEEVKNRIRQHPEIFTTRLIFNQFVSRGFADESKLRQAVEEKINASLEKKKPEIVPPSEGARQLKLSDEHRQTVKVLSDKLQAEVRLKSAGLKGKLEISFQSDEELGRILHILTNA
ncbi:MAG TPA: ParB/RepB/Spo0J family partition protein [Blastocatellia bacterium]|nr:ParB/RepB/Spo0J family partition protein [Blastocatellia bacterium]